MLQDTYYLKGGKNMKNQNITFKIGHVPIKVKNLQSGIKDFERLGFTLTMGSKFNSLIYFKDTSFLEVLCNDMGPFINPLLKVFLSILSLSRSKKNMAKGFKHAMKSPEGFLAYALDSVPGDIYETNIRKMRENGLDVSKPRTFHRTRPDGIKLTWYLSFTSNVYLPFFISDYDPNIPVPEEKLIHKNGVVGVKEMFISTTKWDSTLESCKAIYGQDPEIENKNRHKMCTFKVNSAFVHLVEGDFNGIDEILLLGSENSTEGFLDSTLTHGARIRIVK